MDGYGNAGTDTTVEYKFYYSTDNGVSWTECDVWGSHEITFIPPADDSYIFYVEGRAVGSTAVISSVNSSATDLYLGPQP